MRRPAENLITIEGDIADPRHGWTYIASTTGTLVEVPFEGQYASKGGRIQSPWFPLDKPLGKAACYRLTFKAQTDSQCYWWVDLADAQGQPLPDINSAVYAGPEQSRYDQMVYASGAATHMQIAFQSDAGITVRDINLHRVSLDDAASWCDALLATLPPLADTVPANVFDLLPRTRTALNDGQPWRVVMLGDSIMNDSYNSLFQVLVKRDFPQSEFDFIISVRGSTGCWYYADPEHFAETINRHRPDLLLIGGISNLRSTPGTTWDSDAEAISRTIAMTQELGSEVALLSPPHSTDWRPSDPKHSHANLPPCTWNEDTVDSGGHRRLAWSPYREIARKSGVAFWNLTVPIADYIASSRTPHGYFNRDFIHNNDRGKQIIGRVLQQHFRRAGNTYSTGDRATSIFKQSPA